MVYLPNVNRPALQSELATQQTPSDRLIDKTVAHRQPNLQSTTQLANDSTEYAEQRFSEDTLSALTTGFQSQANADPVALRAALQQAFGNKASSAQIDQLSEQILSGNTPMPANVEVVDAKSLGATHYGAYSTENGGTIYLDARLLNKPHLMQSVFNEELGHHFDYVLGGNDARGDEGAVFAQAFKSGPLDDIALTRLQLENDAGFIYNDGKLITVEFRNGGDNHSSYPGNENDSTTKNSGHSESDNDEERKAKPATPPPTPPPTTPQTQDTADGPGGGDPEQFEQLTGIPSNGPVHHSGHSESDNKDKPSQPVNQNPATPDGPGGGDPKLWDWLTGIGSPWSAPLKEDDSESESKSGSGSAGVAEIGLVGGLALAPLIKKISTSLRTVLGGLFGSATTATIAGVAGVVVPGNIGVGSNTHTIAGTDITIKVNPGSLEGTVYRNGAATTITLLASGVDANGHLTGFRPANKVDAQNLGSLMNSDVSTETVLDTVFSNEDVEGVEETEGAEEKIPGSRTQEEYDELAQDPAHGGKLDPKGKREREVGLGLEESGEVKGPIVRDPSGDAEFIDGDGQTWDVKGFNSNYPPNKGGFDVDRDADKVDSELESGENVMIDTEKLTPSDVEALREEGKARGWGDRVKWY